MSAVASRLIYRPPQACDVQRLFAIYGDPQTNVFNPSGPIASLEGAQRLLDKWLEQWATQGYGWWAIARTETPHHIIGFGGIAPLDYLAERRINLGYRFAVQAWGQGYATELGRDALALAFQTLGLGEVFGLVRPDHGASIRVLEKIGMQPFGVLDDVPGKAPSLVFRICHPTTDFS
ncbi:GNAT family N-acetyltransferase [Pseudomonas simiae]|jgi:RimJ/RimL family protein N-acetyltransferase|uniref:GNAT family N-acetyltransferase n=1 Tax=Pseudomonas simiae TaxID=321846 RepID=UPI001654502B|nr:GNAT family N-acetyltransferase [Pseudomonas simiae]MBC3962548.1 GNAT family N-acetyltransferase [Pseudomonas simiae]MBJ2230650.1 GNAT family N-acetyltransferase [Pseudomonas simiae]UNK63986.1 GNAT family N-acetyltransferase [Pseudomonas simiae]WLG71475.1 GNAT family N-acetyltransferase [Pseudomonas simiae]